MPMGERDVLNYYKLYRFSSSLFNIVFRGVCIIISIRKIIEQEIVKCDEDNFGRD